MLTTILYHKNCNDGTIAALNFYAYYEERNELDDVIFMPVQYGESLPDESIIKGRVVYIVDFSFPRGEMAKIVELASYTVLLDHHQTAIHNLFTGEKWLSGYSKITQDEEIGQYLADDLKYRGEVNKKFSGATLAYREIGELVDDPRVNRILQYLSQRAEDRDNWVFKYGDSKAVHEHIRSLGSDLPTLYEKLFGNDQVLDDLLYHVKLAQVRVDMRDELANNYAKLAKPIQFMGHQVPAVNVPSDFASIVGDILGKNAPFAIMYTVTSEHALLSLRSNKQTGVNVEEIAAQLGGGGHRNAAGVRVTHSDLIDILRSDIDASPSARTQDIDT